MTEEEKKAHSLVKMFYTVDRGYQWCEAKKEALKVVELILEELYEHYYDVGDRYEFYLKVKKKIEQI